ncbi:MAG TPA: GDP-L-fucose synthase [Methylovirgula sp.]
MSEAAPAFRLAGRRVFVAGHAGMVGTALSRRLAQEGCEMVTASRASLDLRDQTATEQFLKAQKPDAVVICAARVGGIEANRTLPADFLFDNLAIEMNLIHGAHRAGVPRLLFLGSSCMFPRLAEQPIREESLLEGPLEPTNEWYAVAKIAGLKMCQAYRRQHGRDYICAIPTNLYGPGDNFDLAASHVVPALLRKAHEAKLAGKPIEIWGTGTPRREFLYVDDAADALTLLLERYSDEAPINVAGGEDVSIAELTKTVAEVAGFKGEINFDRTKPDGMPRKALDAQRILATGWRPKWTLRAGLETTYAWFCSGEGVRLNLPVAS